MIDFDSEGKAAARTQTVRRACAQAMRSHDWLPALPRTVARFPTGSDSANSPIKYWVSLEDRYPNLSKLAIDMLSITSSSCECERLFSELGDLLEPRRRNISPQQYSVIGGR